MDTTRAASHIITQTSLEFILINLYWNVLVFDYRKEPPYIENQLVALHELPSKYALSNSVYHLPCDSNYILLSRCWQHVISPRAREAGALTYLLKCIFTIHIHCCTNRRRYCTSTRKTTQTICCIPQNKQKFTYLHMKINLKRKTFFKNPVVIMINLINTTLTCRILI